MPKLYTLEQVKKAFWNNFHKSGEIFFNYGDTEKICNVSTKREWETFKQYLNEEIRVK